MDEIALPLKFIISMFLGAAIGIEREVNEKKVIGTTTKATALIGLRTFSLITVLGTIVSSLFVSFESMALLVASAFFILLFIFYFLDSKSTQDLGITTEIAIIYAFLIGFLIGTEAIPVQLIIAITVGLILLLSRKEKIKSVVENIKKEEIAAFVSYAIISLVVLPFLPNTTYSLTDIPGAKDLFASFGSVTQEISKLEIINPFKLWFIVALITGINLFGYVLERTVGGKKGWVVASIVGGFISSTAVTQSLALESKRSKNISLLLTAALLSNVVSFFQIGLLILPINGQLFLRLVPILLLIISSGLAVTYFLFLKNKHEKEAKRRNERKQTTIISLFPALKFVGIYLAVNILSKVALVFFGDSGFLLTTALGAFAGLDAVIINTATLAGQRISYETAALAFILANAVNLFAKSFYAYVNGSKKFAQLFFMSTLLIISASVLGLFFS